MTCKYENLLLLTQSFSYLYHAPAGWECKNLTWLEEYGQSKINSFKRRILLLIRKQEILRLQISMNDPMVMRELHHLQNRPGHGSSSSLRIMPSGNNPIEQLSSFAQFHRQVNCIIVLAGRLQANDARVQRQVLHNCHLTPHIVYVDRCPQLPLRDTLAGKQLPRVPPVQCRTRLAQAPGLSGNGPRCSVWGCRWGWWLVPSSQRWNHAWPCSWPGKLDFTSSRSTAAGDLQQFPIYRGECRPSCCRPPPKHTFCSALISVGRAHET